MLDKGAAGEGILSGLELVLRGLNQDSEGSTPGPIRSRDLLTGEATHGSKDLPQILLPVLQGKEAKAQEDWPGKQDFHMEDDTISRPVEDM